MANDPASIAQILWSTDPATQQAIWLMLGLGLLSIGVIFAPLAIRAWGLFSLERQLRRLSQDVSAAQPGALLDDFKRVLQSSPIAAPYAEFERRWTTAQLVEAQDRAPVRLIDVLEERPLLPFGPRRSLIPVLPSLFITLGVFAALAGVIPGLSSASVVGLSAEARSSAMAIQLGLALRVAAWGFLCAMFASLAGRLIEGAFAARSFGLDEVVESAYGSISPGELAELTRQTQQTSLETLGRELSHFAGELNERLDRGLQRIEQSTARSASLVSQEQRGALHTVVQELSLSVRQGVEHHLSELRGALQRAVEHQNSVTGGLAETFQRMVDNSQIQERVARTLQESATAVDGASRVMSGTTAEMKPVLEHLGSTSRSLATTAERINDTQQVVARTAEGVRGSLEHAASGVADQRQFIEISLGEIRAALGSLGDGLGDSLQRSLREVDDVLGQTVGKLRDTLAESNETIDRLAGPIRAAEGTTRETHVALDRVRSEVEALGLWMNQAVKPLRGGLDDVEKRADEISRAMIEFNTHSRQIDKTMEALREEIHGESRRLQGTGSDLGRRLKETTDAVALLESATSDAARRSRPEPGGARERSWSATPSAQEPSEASRRSLFSPTSFESRSGTNSDEEPLDERARNAAPESPPSRPKKSAASSDSDQDVAGASAGRDLKLSGYRVGAPRAEGPDPYARFDSAEETPSNVHPFPARERELGDELKLSGLLGRHDDDAESKGDEDPDEGSDSGGEARSPKDRS